MGYVAALRLHSFISASTTPIKLYPTPDFFDYSVLLELLSVKTASGFTKISTTHRTTAPP